MILGKMVQERMALCLMTSLFLIQTAPARGGDWVTNLKARWHNHQGGASAEALAGEIEKLEKHIDGYGTIVAKQPDVWGQARLMKHRAEFEQQLSARLGSFKDTLQGSISRSDQAFLASAFSLSAAVSGAPAVQLPQTASISNEIATRQKAALNDAGVTSPTSSQLSGVTSPTTISPPTSNSSSGLTDNFDTTGVIQRTTINNLDTGVKFPSGSTIALEPTEELDQLATYINHLHQLRRLNEGDDVSASPGYALQLVRIPVSILPGSKTRKGYGAEITVTATPYLGRDLLPSTFRNLVINDLVEQNSTLLLEFFNSLSSRQDFVKVRQDLIKAVDSTNYSSESSTPPPPVPPSTSSPFGSRSSQSVGPVAGRATGRSPKAEIRVAGARPLSVGVDPAIRRASQTPTLPAQPVAKVSTGSGRWSDPSKINRFNQTYVNLKTNSNLARSNGLAPSSTGVPVPVMSIDGSVAEKATMAQSLKTIEQTNIGKQLTVASNGVPGTRSRNARYAFPSTQSAEIYGGELILPVVFQAYDVVLDKQIVDSDQPPVVQYQKVAGYIQDQVTAAYDFLARPQSAPLWLNFATPDLVNAVRSRDVATVKLIRSSFLASLPNAGIDDDSPYGPDNYTTTAAFAWAILVESVLLNEQLIKDIHEAATAKGEIPLIDRPLPYFLPCPPDEARDSFNAYVKTRFPIHVFALDPFFIEQNLADQLARTRETQLALSLAFVTGNISASNMTRFARRLELETSTIAVNRTQLAFSHGEDTFGWRFQPRYQTPPTQNNLAALAQTIGGGPTRDGDRRQLELEPGPRECVALVIMPSFVPYVTFETRSNWYRLTNPKHTEIDPTKFLELSASIKRAYRLAQAVCDAGLYRDGDIARLVNRVKQLSAELPMQSMIAQVPYENTHGGFELFNVGITDLAPELRSWYGTPGVSQDHDNLVFLVGDNFSVVSTNVVAGNRAVDPTGNRVTLLSKQVISVTIPAGAQTVIHGGVASVEVTVATPYGVSQPLYIPVLDNTPRLKNAGATGLAPVLQSWSGAPGVSVNNGSSLFLVGDNFTAVGTNVVAGNKLLDPTKNGISLLSRQVMAVTIPAGAQTVTRDKLAYVEVTIATPNGVSEPLFIPVTDSSPVKAAATPNAPIFSWTTPTLTVVYHFDLAGNIQVQQDSKDQPVTRPVGLLSIGLDSNVSLDPTTADLSLFFGAPDDKLTPIELTDVPYNKDTKAFEITEKNFATLINDLFDKNHFGKVFSNESDKTLPRNVTVSRTVIRLKGGKDGPVVPQDVSNTLTIKWNAATSKPAADPSAPAK